MTEELTPTEVETMQIVSIAVVRDLAANASSPRFAAECIAFTEAQRDGDDVVEFCSSLQDWRAGMGYSGYRLIRSGETVRQIIVKLS